MKKSNYIMLTAAFAAAIASYSAKGQEVIHDTPVQDEVVSYDSLTRDSAVYDRTPVYYNGPVIRERWSFWWWVRSGGRCGWHHPHNSQQPATVAHNGFGNTMRPMDDKTKAGS